MVRGLLGLHDLEAVNKCLKDTPRIVAQWIDSFNTCALWRNEMENALNASKQDYLRVLSSLVERDTPLHEAIQYKLSN